ncbi:MAG TPA: hypothetical protein DEF51_07590, partial [Myxococcales bacterium]|nr:hypothetical protein [Myxococcales bacterium]
MTGPRLGRDDETHRMKTYALDKARADGWLEQLGDGSQGFTQLCEVVGERFVAFSVIAGIRITALTVDPRNPDQSVVEFEIGELPGSQRLSLSDFRERLAQAMLSEDENETGAPKGADAESLQSYIGFRYVLLAPLYDIGLECLKVDGDLATIEVAIGGQKTDLPLDDFRDLVRDRVREDVQQQRAPSPFSIDLNLVPRARAAAKAEDSDGVV